MEIYDLDDDDILLEHEGEHNNPNEPEQNPITLNNNDNEDFLLDFLKSKGIEDSSKIKFEGENGQIEEKNWNDLTREELINILNTPLTQPEEDNLFDAEEIELLNEIRKSGLTPSEYITQLLNLQTTSEPEYQIDSLSDDEVYLIDLESRVGELSDEEAAQALSIAKLNEDFFKKQVEGIRKEYKEREDLKAQQDQAEIEEQLRIAYEKYQANIVDAINGFTSVGNLDLNFEDSDKEELADFMLSQDENGVNYLYRALQDPETLVKAAWFILNGDEALNNVSDYFINEIKTVSENWYKKGYEDAKNGISSQPKVVILQNKKNQHRLYKSIEDLDDED